MIMKHLLSRAQSALILFTGASSYNVYDLSEAKWTLAQPSGNISIPAKFPSQAHVDLFAEGVIDDPYRNLNDFDQRWVTYSNWTYSANLPNSSYTKGTRQWLVFDGLDTFTSISLCGQHVAATNNQFRQYFFDVSDILSSCQRIPCLSVNFGSAINISSDIAAQPGQETWPYPVQGTFEFPNRWFIRKQQSDFGWDWGPAFAPAGPWLPGRMVTLGESDVYIRNTLIDIYRQGQRPLVVPDQSKPWVVDVSLDILGSLPAHAGLKYTLTGSSGAIVTAGSLKDVTQSPGVISGTVVLTDVEPDLWWPVGFGPQTLYHMTIEVTGTSNAASVTKRTGFRTIVQNADSISDAQRARGIAPGNNWHFEINGREFYAKGSNYIPQDAFLTRVTKESVAKLFDAVVLGGQNMLRVWSSGAYPFDFMYDLADEMGIMLWCEFEFGDALYPINAEFIDNVKDEVYYQVRRANHHPSLSYWAGGNELENLELYLVRSHAPQLYDKYFQEYEYLFLDTIVPILFANSRSVSYSPSSTSNGWLALDFSKSQPITERYNNKTTGSIYGVTDYYNYRSDIAFNLSTYPVGRFANEFGYHSMPSRQGWETAVDAQYLRFNSSVITLRNHHYPAGGPATDNFANASKGMAEMTLAVQRWYPTPNKQDALANFTCWCLATQIFQAAFYKSQIQVYRRGSGLPQRTLGSLYWQLEDIWPAPTWAGVEHDGRWKPLHYTARDIYKNVIVAPYFDADSAQLDVYVTTDLWSEAVGTASFEWYDWAGTTLHVGAVPPSVEFTVGALNTTRVLRVNVSSALDGFDWNDVVLRMHVSANSTGRFSGDSGEVFGYEHTSWFHPASLAHAKLVDPGLRVAWDEGNAAVTVEATTGVGAWTWVDYPAGVTVALEDNAFWLAKGERKMLKVLKTWGDSTGGAWTKGVTVSSLWDFTQP